MNANFKAPCRSDTVHAWLVKTWKASEGVLVKRCCVIPFNRIWRRQECSICSSHLCIVVLVCLWLVVSITFLSLSTLHLFTDPVLIKHGVFTNFVHKVRKSHVIITIDKYRLYQRDSNMWIFIPREFQFHLLIYTK